MTLDPQSATNLQPSAMLAASERPQYVIDPQNPQRGEESTIGHPTAGGNFQFPGTFEDGFNLSNVAPTKLGHLIIDPANPGDPSPSSYSTSAPQRYPQI